MRNALLAFASLFALQAFGATVNVVTHIDYKSAATDQLEAIHEEQVLEMKYESFENHDSIRNHAYISLDPKRSDRRPLMLEVNNAGATLQGIQVPFIDLRFTFREKKIDTDHPYECTENPKDTDSCRVQLSTSRLYLGIPNSKTVCKLSVKTAATLDFSDKKAKGTLLAFPSAINKEIADGLPFEMQFDCVSADSGASVLKGYFTHKQ